MYVYQLMYKSTESSVMPQAACLEIYIHNYVSLRNVTSHFILV